MRLPKFTDKNYLQIMGAEYEQIDKTDWVELKEILEKLTDDFVKKYENVSALKLGEYKQNVELCFIKRLIPTLWLSEYFLWNIGNGTHTGVDIIMPKGTPLVAFIDGKITRIKKRDGVKKDEGNCVVIETNVGGEKVYICYEHLDEIKAEVGKQVKRGDIIGTCGKTGNSTQYHLHLQVDNDKAQFHPYWSGKIEEIKKYTLNPIKILQKIYEIKEDINNNSGNNTNNVNKEINNGSNGNQEVNKENEQENKNNEKQNNNDQDLISEIFKRLR